MRTICIILLLLFTLAGFGQKIYLLKFDELQKRVVVKNDTLYVVNFWATWCRPCVEELPYFEKCDSEFKSKPVKIILVNLDFNSSIKTLAEPFVIRNKLHSEIVHITESDPGTWINRVDSTWSGAIPATIIYNSSTKAFFKEGEMNLDELRIKISDFLNGIERR